MNKNQYIILIIVVFSALLLKLKNKAFATHSGTKPKSRYEKAQQCSSTGTMKDVQILM